MPTTKYLAEGTSLQAVADAIRTKTGDSGQLTFPAGFVSAIEDIPSGGGSGGGTIKPNAKLVLIDYDGSVVDSYTQSEVDALSALPANPDHSGDEIPLTSQGWNWTLAEVREQLTAMPEQTVWVGQMYVPTDGKTHIVIYLDPEGARKNVSVRFQQSKSNGVKVDWGDGSTPETYSGTSVAEHAHTYNESGMYDITLEQIDGTCTFVGSYAANGYSIFGSVAVADSYRHGRIRELRIGNNVIIGRGAFNQCASLKTITMPQGITATNQNETFYQCPSLRSVTIPAGWTRIGSYAFTRCYSMSSISMPKSITVIDYNSFIECQSLTYIAIPNSVTSINSSVFEKCQGLAGIGMPSALTTIGSGAFRACYSLTGITIPECVTSIGNNAFNEGYAFMRITFKPTTPPTLSNTNVFALVPTYCIFYVPYSADHSVLEAYKTANIWSTYASRMVEEDPPSA